MKRIGLAATALLVLVVGAAGPLAALEVPPRPQAWVTDRAGVVDPDVELALNRELEEFHRRSGSQMLVFTLPSLEGESLEGYTARVAEMWKVNDDRGLILFVFPEDRQMRIEVGYGLEGTVTDALASRIVRRTLAPAFREGRYGEGIAAAVAQLTTLVEEGVEALPPDLRSEPEARIDPGTLIFLLVIAWFLVGPLLFGRRGRRGGCMPLFLPFPLPMGGTTIGGGGWGGGRGGGGWSVGGSWGGGGFGSFGGGGASGSW